jgi:hypothetical protein
MKNVLRLVLVCLGLTVLNSYADFLPSNVIYVKSTQTQKPQDGKTWATAYRSLTDALKVAKSGNDIWVAAGTYTPTTTDDKTASFQLKTGVELYGGFKGDEAFFWQRKWTKNQTILSGKIKNGYVYHVLRGANNATLSGFIITDGHATGQGINGMGGGMLNTQNQSPTILDCVFKENVAITGGAISNYIYGSPSIIRCQFVKNTAKYGGAIANRSASSPQLYEAIFENNTAKYRGGAIYNDYGSSPNIRSSIFIRNQTQGNGGAVYTIDRASQYGLTYPQLIGCKFIQNAAKYYGGAIDNYDVARTLVQGCYFSKNKAFKGSAISTREKSECSIQKSEFKERSQKVYTDTTSKEGENLPIPTIVQTDLLQQ